MAPVSERVGTDADLGLSPAKARHRPPRPSGLPPEVERQAISKTLDDYCRPLLDEMILAVGNRSSRSVAKTAKVREKRVTWLKRLQNHGARLDAGDPMASDDFSWLWRKLALSICGGDHRPIA